MTTITESAPPLAKIEGLAVTFFTPRGSVRALRNVSLEVGRGEVLGVVGESGCGKSTMAFAIMGYLPGITRVEGTIQFEGQEIADMRASDLRELRGNRIAMVYQDPATSLNPTMRVGPQIEEVLRTHMNMDAAAARERVAELFRSVNLADPERVGRRYPHQLSGGMQQRVGIAMALACGPDLLIMDEPTTGLDVTTEATILDLVVELKDRVNAGIIYVSHNLGVIARVADRVAVMYAGQVVEEAPVRDLFKSPKHPYTAGLLACVPQPPADGETATTLRSIPGSVFSAQEEAPEACLFAERCPIARDECHSQSPGLFDLGDAHSARCFFSKDVGTHIWGEAEEREERVRSTEQPVLEATGLRRFYGRWQRKYIFFGPRVRPPVRAVSDIDFQVGTGSTLGVVGESGSGKTTAARAVAGLVPRSRGDLRLRGEDLASAVEDRTGPQKAAMSMVFQNPAASLNPKRPIKHAILRSLRKFAGLGRRESRERAQELMEAVGLDPAYLDRPPGELSGGQQQRVALAAAFAANPEVIIADEAVSALDVSVQGPGAQPPGRAPEGGRLLLHVHLPRPGRRALRLRRHPCPLRRPRRRVRPRRGRAQRAVPPIHRGAAVGGPRARPGRRAKPDSPPRRRAHPPRAVPGLLLRRALPSKDRPNLRRHAAAGQHRPLLAGPPHLLPHPRGTSWTPSSGSRSPP